MTVVAPLLDWNSVLRHGEGEFQNKPALYAGTSDDKGGWVVRFEPAWQSGLIVGPIGMLPICGVVVDRGGLSFHAAAMSGVRYTFNGRISASILEGSIEAGRAEGQHQAWSQRLRLRTVSASGALRGESRVEGVCVTSSGSAGVGSELVLLGDRDSTVALYVERDASQSRASRPSRVTPIGDTLHFQWQGHDVKAVAKLDTKLVNGRALARIGSLDEVVARMGGRCP